MKLVVQRVTEASVSVEQEIVGSIGQGCLVLLGVGENDTEEIASRLADKLVKLRIFSDENDKTNLSINDVEGEVLVISQFTLYADCKKNRPSFCHAGKPDLAEHLYEYFMDCLRPQVKNVEHGVFGAMMQVSLCNDGPFTVILEG
jgi:D-tyrosyl-tRNA(Tyr) deacylase